MKNVFKQNFYCGLFFVTLSIACAWMYEKVIRPRRVEKQIRETIKEIRLMNPEWEDEFSALGISGMKDSISKF